MRCLTHLSALSCLSPQLHSLIFTLSDREVIGRRPGAARAGGEGWAPLPAAARPERGAWMEEAQPDPGGRWCGQPRCTRAPPPALGSSDAANPCPGADSSAWGRPGRPRTGPARGGSAGGLSL
ncbi:hypothetical protein PVAP13_7NG065200 [Panicum virgatum]|uniref:Uncharacterized protein n=1 Tax=Panicum virgatum TaxID=38727 RepID=A0A8T0PU98_PANVG|nr:hypothetical protein PVAP13_7NG065200 [Panicum virgatum]